MRMKQLSVVPTAWIADQMEEEEMVTTGNQKWMRFPLTTNALWYVVIAMVISNQPTRS